jgi:hypothetical protein
MARHALLLAAVVLVTGSAADAHHSISGVYDSNRQVTIDGIVAKFELVHPHPFLLIDVEDATGVAQRWKGELDNRSELVAIGVTASTWIPGDRVVVSGSAARAQAQSLYVLRLDRPTDGFRYEQVGSNPRVRKVS